MKRCLLIALIMIGVFISIIFNAISVLKGIELLWISSILIFIISFWNLLEIIFNGKGDNIGEK